MKHKPLDVKRAAREASVKATIIKQREFPDFGTGKDDIGAHTVKGVTADTREHRLKITGRSDQL